MLHFTADNLFGFPAGEYGPDIASGYFILVAPLSVGPHTIHFRWGVATGPFAGEFEVTYHLTVAGRE